MFQGKKRFWFILGLGIFIFLILKLDLKQSLEKLRCAHPGWMGLSLGLVVLTQFLGYSKWKIMYCHTMEDRKQPLLPIFSSILVTGMITPARAGDMLASLTWKKMQGRVLAWSVFHRISEGVMTLVLSFSVLGIFFRSRYGGAQWAIGFVFFGVIVAGIFLILHRQTGQWFFRFAKKFLLGMKKIPLALKILSLEEKIKQQLDIFYNTLTQFRARHILWLLIGVTLVSRVIIILVNMTLLRALGANLSPVQVLGILAVTWVGSFLSPTPSGIGVGDIAPTVILSHLGYQNRAGAYILINRLIDISIIGFWAYVFASQSKVQSNVSQIDS